MTQQDFVMVANVPQRARKKQAAVKYALVVTVFIILAVAYYYSFRRFARSSDDANILLAGQEMSNGNWRLKGWWLPEDNFLTTHVLLYAILVKCIGFTPYTMFYLPAILWAGVASLSVVLAQGGRTGKERAVAVAAVTTPILLPIIRNNGAMDQIAHDWAHAGTILYVLFCFLFAKMAMSGQRARSTPILLAYTLIMVLAVFGDSFAIFIGAMPVIAVAAFSSLYGSKPGPNRLVLVLTILAAVLGRILVEVNSLMGGFQLLHLQMRFVPFDDLGKNVASVVQYFFQLFGCDFFGKDVFAISINGPALSLIRLPFLVLLIAALVHIGKRFFASIKATDRLWPVVEGDYLDALLAVAVTINVLAGVFSNRITDASAIRYFFPALVFGAILIARTQTVTRWLGAYFYLALLASMAFSLMAYARNPRKPVLVAKEIEAVSSWLSNNDLSNGFGPYWSSSIVTAATENRVQIRALIVDGEGKLKPFEWEANKKWYHSAATGSTRRIFVLAHEAESNFYREADVLRTMGEPLDKHEVGPYIVNVYDASDQRLRSQLFR